MASPARMISSYEIKRELGQGGMGIVYLAEQPALERRVVLKTLRQDLGEMPSLEERFKREAQAAASVHHQNVVSVYDCFTWRGARYIAQEFVDGVDLSTVLKNVGRVDPHVTTLIALELARGLEEIHAQGIVHRDMKPSNILLGRAGDAKIADFGIAYDPKEPALTQTGQAIGTPPYMSPEQYLGERVDYRSDLFSIGVVFYEMVTGQQPFAQNDPESDDGLVRRITDGRYAAPRKVASDTPRYLARLIRACLQPKAKKRLPSATALRRSLERHLGSPAPADCRNELAAWLWEQHVFDPESDETVVVLRPQKPVRARVRRQRIAVAVAVAAALVGGGAGINRVGVEALPGLADLPKLKAAIAERWKATVRFEVAAGTEIRIDGGEPVRSTAQPVELSPGIHRVVFQHPKHGTASQTLVIAAGQERVIRPELVPPRSQAD